MDEKKILRHYFITIRQDDASCATQRILAAFTSIEDVCEELSRLKENLGPTWKVFVDGDIPLDQTIQYPIKTDVELKRERELEAEARDKEREKTGYAGRYDTYYNKETGEWLEKIGFCRTEENCPHCEAYKRDGSPKTAFDAPPEALTDPPIRKNLILL